MSPQVSPSSPALGHGKPTFTLHLPDPKSWRLFSKTSPDFFQDGYTATAKIRELEAEYLHSPSISPSGPAHGSEEADFGSRRRDGSVRANNRLWRHGSAGVRKSHELEKALSGSLECLPSWYSRVPIIALTAGEEVGWLIERSMRGSFNRLALETKHYGC
jgi:hypothetical protein